MNRIICGDCLTVLPTLPGAAMIFADPPDNLRVMYDDWKDSRPDYLHWLEGVVYSALAHRPPVFWLSHYFKWTPSLLHNLTCLESWEVRQFIWRFTFGQHRETDCGNGYRPLLRFSQPGVVWHSNDIRIPSARLEKYHDKRANPAGRVPDDVWDFPRVCGTFKERRPWHPNQHPEALIERLVRLSTNEGDTVIDMFAGTGTVGRVCHRLGRHCISIELNPNYCTKIGAEAEDGSAR